VRPPVLLSGFGLVGFASGWSCFSARPASWLSGPASLAGVRSSSALPVLLAFGGRAFQSLADRSGGTCWPLGLGFCLAFRWL
jgi:hypothetical protein